MKELRGYRTLIGGIVGMATLVLGLWMVESGHRHEGYFAFATGVGCIVGALAAKSVGTVGAGAIIANMTGKKGDPK